MLNSSSMYNSVRIISTATSSTAGSLRAAVASTRLCREE